MIIGDFRNSFHFILYHFTFARLKWEFGSPLTFQGVKVSVCCWTKAGSIKWSRKLWGKWYSSKPKLVAWLNKRSLKLVPQASSMLLTERPRYHNGWNCIIRHTKVKHSNNTLSYENGNFLRKRNVMDYFE